MRRWIIEIEVETEDHVDAQTIKDVADKLSDDASMRLGNEVEGESTVLSVEVSW